MPSIDRDTFILIFILIIFMMALVVYKQTAIYNDAKDSLIHSFRSNSIRPIYDSVPAISPTPANIRLVPTALYEVDKDHQRIINPLEPPERSNPYRPDRFGMPVNIPSRGLASGFQQVGALFEEDAGKDPRILPLFGEITYPGSRMWRYYTGTDQFPTVKLGVSYRNRDCMDDTGCEEIYDGQTVKVDGYECDWRAKIYKLDRPRYNPYII